MWQADAEAITAGHRYRLAEDGAPLAMLRFLEYLRDDDGFAHWLTGIIATSPYGAVYWEMPPLCDTTLESATEFVLIDAPRLARMRADPGPFRAHFERAHEDVVVFPNLGGDALLIVPVPRDAHGACAHLAEFVRHAPRNQVRSLWRSLSETAIGRIGAAPTWLSTAGDGVAWLHVRLDSRPKYYQHREYAASPDTQSR